MDKKPDYWSKFLTWLVYSFIFIFSIYPYSDTDWGWHYRYGEYFIKTGSVLRKDIFSWTMNGFRWINPSWFYDVFLYVSFKYVGFAGLMVIGGLIALLVYYISIKPFRLQIWQKIILGLFSFDFVTLILRQSLRSQILILPFYPILAITLMKSKEKPKLLFFLPLVFLLWANLHASFTLGLAIMFILLLTKIIFGFKNEKPNLKIYLAVMVLSFLATLVNPFTLGLYFEALRHTNNQILSSYVVEWMPFFNYFRFGYFQGYIFISYILIMVVGFIRRRKISDIPYVVTIFLLVYLTFESFRFVGPLLAFSLPVVAMMAQEIKINLKKPAILQYLTSIFLVTLIMFGIKNRIIAINMFNYQYDDYCYWSTHCSEKLTRYLLKNPPVGNGFNFFDWGGYLIGRGIKSLYFVDGRMVTWKADNFYPFVDYYNIYYKKDYRRFAQYNFDWVIIPSDSNIAHDLLKNNFFLGSWKRVYYDEKASYFVRQR
ncbi:hypothetical protein M1328_02005 [Patescibacteria group bacterium]|nr:hypothetical protein [Patescibacteria group bacterium]